MNQLRRPTAGGRNPHASGSGGAGAPPGSARVTAAMAGGSENAATGVYSASGAAPPGNGLPDWFHGEASAALGSDWLSSEIGVAHPEEEDVLPTTQSTPSTRRRGGSQAGRRTRPPTQTTTPAADTDASMADWTDENTRIVCQIFAEQVLIGNRSTTHLNKAGFTNVIQKFKERTNILHTRKQFKNKWEKLKLEYGIWKQLVDQTGIGWDESGQNINMPEEWWKKMANAVKGSMRFRYKGLQNEDNLSIMFEDLRNTGDDHWGASSGVAPSEAIPLDDEEEGENEDDSDPDDVTPSARPKRGKAQVDAKGKKTKTSGSQWFQEQMGKLVEMNERTTASCESIAKGDGKSGLTIQEVMALVKDCGAKAGSKEHFIATVIFTKKAEREMFMTLDGPEERFMWLQQKHEWMTRNAGAK